MRTNLTGTIKSSLATSCKVLYHRRRRLEVKTHTETNTDILSSRPHLCSMQQWQNHIFLFDINYDKLNPKYSENVGCQHHENLAKPHQIQNLNNQQTQGFTTYSTAFAYLQKHDQPTSNKI